MKTIYVTPKDNKKKWYLVDATGLPLGRLASEVAKTLRGKYNKAFVPHWDLGDNVIIINANHVKFTGNKSTDKMYYFHSGYPGALTEVTHDKMKAKKPEFPIVRAVKNMLPKNPLGYSLMRNLRVYPEAEHPYTGMKTEPFPFIKKAAEKK